MKRRTALYGGGGAALLVVCLGAWLALATQQSLRPLPGTLVFATALSGGGGSRGSGGIEIDGVANPGWRGMQVLDRRGEPLNATFTNGWNLHDLVPLHEVPEFLRNAFVTAEDKRFFEHGGPDWRARASAVWTNVTSGRAVRGASTISEQVVRMLHPRPRTVWSRWLEGFEARELEQRFTKNEILEFYLNQVPYASNRRGVRQAASFYFARDLATLSKKEMLALAVLVRAPTRFDLKRGVTASAGAAERLAAALVERGTLTSVERDAVLAEPLVLDTPQLAVAAPHFIEHVRAERLPTARAKVATTLDARLQAKVQGMLDERMSFLASRRVANGAVLAVDHSNGEVLAWVVAGGGGEDGPKSHIDAVTTPRQPGSALKPFLYALALDNGWTAAEIIDDAPLRESTSGGLHSYQNYSRRFYGEVALRDALGNSLNIPALKTLQHVGTEPYLRTLAALGFAGLTRHPDFYGDGIALGSGAVTLLELVQAYATLANRGVYRPVAVTLDGAAVRGGRRVYSPEAASLVANILADADARALEFGRDSVLAFPVQTAVKTGTSNDFRDAWAVGFNYRYTVGVWMGNLDQTPTDGVTGSIGPALLLRSVFAELTRDAQTRPLYLSSKLKRAAVCVPMPLRQSTAGECLQRDEWFIAGTEARALANNAVDGAAAIRLRQPTPGLQLAYDPRIPPESQVFEFALQGVAPADRVRWTVDGRVIDDIGATYRWRVSRGDHRVTAAVWQGDELVARLDETLFHVK